MPDLTYPAVLFPIANRPMASTGSGQPITQLRLHPFLCPRGSMSQGCPFDTAEHPTQRRQ